MLFLKRCFLNLLLVVFKLFPVKRKRIVFMSFNGHFSDSPKYIFQKIYELSPDKEYIWLVKKQYFENVPACANAVDFDRKIKRLWLLSTASVIVDNVYAGRSFEKLKNSRFEKLKFDFHNWVYTKKHQTVFTTWHGTPLKRMGRHQVGSTIIDFTCPNTEMLLGNKFTADVMEDICFNKIPMKLLGTPRNDLLFDEKKNVNEMKKKLSLPIDKKVVLYAPTFRHDGNNIDNRNVFRSGLDQLKEFNFEQLFGVLSDRFGGEWILVCRFHYLVESMVPWGDLQEKYPNKIFNGNMNDDMAEYLSCTDFLITDASSSMFDYMLTYKPCALYFPDVEHYKTVERGFYKDIETLPFPLATDFLELVSEISRFDSRLYKAELDTMITEWGYMDDAFSSNRVAKYILEKSISDRNFGGMK